MTIDEISRFVEKVASMRESQKTYKRTRDLGALQRSELQEADVDRTITALRRKIDKETEGLNLGLF